MPAVLSGLVLCLDASDPSTIVSSGGLVSRWLDKSGLGDDGFQATGGNQPAVGSVAINGLSTLSFDDSSSFLSLTVPIDGTVSTGFAVASYPNSLGSGPILGQSGGSAYWGLYQTIPLYFITSVDGLAYTMSGRTVPTVYGYTSTSASGGSQALYLNGSSVATRSGGLGGCTFDTVGHRLSGEWLNGNLGAVLLYDRVLSSGEIAAVSADLLSRWGITP
jgi:hypothetical protein